MQYRIRGGNPLYGAVSAQGSKNAVLPILFASLLVPCPVTLEQVPRLKDVEKTVLLLEDMGAKTDWQGNTLRICCEKLRQPSSSALPLLSSMRASSYLLGAGIARFGGVTLPWPGGCDFGTRPLNYHQFILSRMGAVWKETPEGVSVKAKELHGCEAVLPYPSVGATVNGVLAALGAKGTTLLKGCAKEKHVLCFLSFLKRCGADVVSLDGDTLLIRGQTALHGCRFRICPDGMEAGTYLIGAAACGGSVTVSPVDREEMMPLYTVFKKMNIACGLTENGFSVQSDGRFNGTEAVCRPYPGFPTDLHPQLGALLCLSQTGGSIRDTVWKHRLKYTEELRKMGADLTAKAGKTVFFPSSFHGSVLRAVDLRAGAALAAAALAADGESVITEAENVQRGYENFAEKWRHLGGEVWEEP